MWKNRFVHNKRAVIIVLVVITMIGIFFRLHNLSPFRVYPDSYQSLLVAKNITSYHNVVGFLGSQGMIYPDFFAWTRPGYPLIIDLITPITHSLILAAQIIAFAAGIIAIPLSFLFIKKIFGSSSLGIGGAFLMAFSISHTIWGGFIMTETLGIFLMLLFLFSVFSNINRPSSFINWHDLITGFLFACIVITRYEYLVIILSVSIFILFVRKKPFICLLNISVSFLFFITVIGIQIFPLQSSFVVIKSQLQNLFLRTGLPLLFFFFLLAGVYMLPKKVRSIVSNYCSYMAILLLLLFILFLVLPFGSSLFLSFQNFLFSEILLSVFSIIGFTMIIINPQTRRYGFFSLASCLCLVVIYYRINPEMSRYLTHIIPFLLIPASHAFVKTVKKIFDLFQLKHAAKAYTVLGFLIVIIVLQGILTYNGMKYSQDASWYRLSYEEEAAAMVKKYISNKNYLLIASYPEPYFFITSQSTQSIADTYPYLYIDNVPDDRQLLIIQDMGMHKDFPKFTKFLTRNLQKDKVVSFWVHEKFHYLDMVENEDHPVILYRATLKGLKEKIKQDAS